MTLTLGTERKDRLLEEAGILLEGIVSGTNNGDYRRSWSCPEVLKKAIKVGLLDAPIYWEIPMLAVRFKL